MTKVYGCSDDLIEVEGEVTGEVGCYGTDDRDQGVLLVFSDNTLLEVKYGKAGMAVWEVRLIKKGDLFDRIDPCLDESAKTYSDVAHFKPGLKWAFAANSWERLK